MDNVCACVCGDGAGESVTKEIPECDLCNFIKLFGDVKFGSHFCVDLFYENFSK